MQVKIDVKMIINMLLMFPLKISTRIIMKLLMTQLQNRNFKKAMEFVRNGGRMVRATTQTHPWRAARMTAWRTQSWSVRSIREYYYPYKVDDFHIAINACGEALEFCSNTKYTTRSKKDSNDLMNSCPYVYVMRNFPGQLVSYNGSVLHSFDGKQEGDGIHRDVPLWKFLEAAGVNSIDSRISQTNNKILRDMGGVFMITIKFHLDLDKVGYLGGFFSNPDTQLLPTKFTVRVEKLAEAGYKVREVVGHSRTHRRVRTSYGLHFKLMLAGKARKFSWSKLLSEIILKFGLFAHWFYYMD